MTQKPALAASGSMMILMSCFSVMICGPTNPMANPSLRACVSSASSRVSHLAAERSLFSLSSWSPRTTPMIHWLSPLQTRVLIMFSGLSFEPRFFLKNLQTSSIPGQFGVWMISDCPRGSPSKDQSRLPISHFSTFAA